MALSKYVFDCISSAHFHLGLSLSSARTLWGDFPLAITLIWQIAIYTSSSYVYIGWCGSSDWKEQKIKASMAYLAEFSPQARLSLFASIRKNTPFRYWVLLNVVGGFGLIVFMACHMEDIHYWCGIDPPNGTVTEFIRDIRLKINIKRHGFFFVHY